MATRAADRRIALARATWRELPWYASRTLRYRLNAWRDPAWAERPQLVGLRVGGELVLEIVPRDAIGGFIYRYGLWDLLGTKFFLAYLRPGMVVLDVGANIGYFTLLASARVGGGGVVESFEPHPVIRARLERSIARNRLGNVVVRPEAVTCSRGEVPFYLSRNADNQGTSSTLEGSSAPEELREAEPLLVPATSLDEIAAALRRPLDLIKLDVEGGEYRALEGGTETLSAADAPLVLFESYAIAATAPLLEGLGFTVARIGYDWRRGIRLDDDLVAPDVSEPNFIAYKPAHRPALAGLA